MSTIRLTRDRVIAAIDKASSYNELEKLYPALGVVVNENITIAEIDEILVKLGYNQVFKNHPKESKLIDFGYPPKPDLVVTFHIMMQIIDPHIETLRKLKF